MSQIASSFRYLEAPVQSVVDLLESQTDNRVDSLQNCLCVTLGWASSWISFPILITAIPLTITVDMVAGLAEALFRSCRDGFNDEIKEILYQKWLVSPIQQLTFLASSLTAVALIIMSIIPMTLLAIYDHNPFKSEPTIFVDEFAIENFALVSFFFPLLLHFIGHYSVKSLPQGINHERFNILNNLENIITSSKPLELPEFDAFIEILKSTFSTAKEGKIPGISKEDAESFMPKIYESLLALAIFAFILSKDNYIEEPMRFVWMLLTFSNLMENLDKDPIAREQQINGRVVASVQTIVTAKKLSSAEIEEVKSLLIDDNAVENASKTALSFCKQIQGMASYFQQNSKMNEILNAIFQKDMSAIARIKTQYGESVKDLLKLSSYNTSS